MKRLPLDESRLAQLCRRRGIRRLSLFGSVLKGTDRPDSDIDLLVEFEPGSTPGDFGMAEIEAELSQLLRGRRVDLRTAQVLSRHFRDELIVAMRNRVVRGYASINHEIVWKTVTEELPKLLPKLRNLLAAG